MLPDLLHNSRIRILGMTENTQILTDPLIAVIGRKTTIRRCSYPFPINRRWKNVVKMSLIPQSHNPPLNQQQDNTKPCQRGPTPASQRLMPRQEKIPEARRHPTEKRSNYGMISS